MLRIAIPLTALFWSMAACADDDQIIATGRARLPPSCSILNLRVSQASA